MKLKLLVLALLVSGLGWSQVTIFNETIGGGSGTLLIAATTFDNAGFTFSGTADTRTTTVSTGYAGASGERNVFFTNTLGRNFQISGIDTSLYTNLVLSFGHFKSTTESDGTQLVVEVSSDGITYNPLIYTRATGTGTANWILITPTGTIPSTPNLRIRFTQTSATHQFRVDDIRLVGDLSCPAPANPTGVISGTTPACGSTSLSFSGTAPANVIYYWQTAASGTSMANNANAALSVSTSGNYYVRAYNTVDACWSTGSVGPYAVVVNAIPSEPTTANPAATCQGTPVVITGVGGGATTYTFWDSPTGGFQYTTGGNFTYNSPNLTVGSGVTSGTYNFYIQGQNGSCLSPTRRMVTLVINPLPATPTGTIAVSANPACGSATLSYPAGFYWQTTATGTSTAFPTSSNYILNTTGTVYVRALSGSCWSSALASPAVTVHTPITITTQPVLENINIPGGPRNFSVAATGTGLSYQWQIDTGSGFSNLVNGAPYSNVTTATMSVNPTTLAMNGHYFRCVVSGTAPCTAVTSDAGRLKVFPNNATALTPCIGNTEVGLSWTASTSVGTVGYMVFALAGATAPEMSPATAGNASSYIANTNYTLATTYGTLGRLVYKGTDINTNITGLTLGQQYTFKVVAYNMETYTGWANGINTLGSWNQTLTTGVPNVNITGASTAPNSCAITWTNPLPTSCYETLIVANQGGPVVFTPTGDGSAYTANATYSGPNQVVFKGVGTATTVLGLTQDVEYCYTVFVRRGTQWSTGVSICRTTGAVYCASNVSPSVDDNTGITQVQFNTINQSSSGNPSYTNFTAVSTTVLINQTYNLTVNVDTDGFQTYTKAWIDWNRDGDFTDAGEEYDLGDTYGAATLTSNSPLSIYVPANALPGNTRMRIATQYFFDDSDVVLAPCANEYDWGEVEDYTINIQRPPGAEINVISNNITILSGFDAPFSLNNTLYGATNLGATNGPRTFTIQNLGLSALNLTGTPLISVVGDHPGDFVVTQPSASTIASTASLDFTITFQPQVGGVRNAIISIANNDGTGSENPYTFAVRGTGVCSTPILSTITPTSGPVGTEVTLTATQNDYVGAVVRYNGVLLTTTQVSATQIKVIVPAGAVTGSFSIVNSTGCTITVPFAIIDTVTESCAGNTADVRTQLFISEVTDHGSGSHTYIELYNPTSGSIPLTGYSVRTHNNGATTATSTINLTGSIAANSTYLIAIGASDAGSNFGGHTPNLISSTTQGINNNDHIRLYNGAVWQDLWGNTANVVFTIADKDYTYRRLNEGIIAPSTTWNPNDWTAITPVDYTNIGQYASSAGIPPIVDQQPTFEPTCKTVVLEVEASEGVVDATGILYQWFVAIPGQSGWSVLSNGGVYSGANSNVLTISDITGLDGYQYYCQVRENNVTCYVASEAVVIREPQTIIWDGVDWTSSIIPSFNTNVVFDADYDTAIHGDVTACACTINAGSIVDIASNDYFDIYDSVTNLGTLNIANSGSLKQHNDEATNTGNIKMTRTTRNMYRWDYVYWGSPVEENIIAQIPTQFDKKYKWVPGVGANWFILDAVTPGQGFITRVRNIAPFTILAEPDRTISFDFTGKPNNGLVNATMTRVDADALNFGNYNLLANPYPSAIDAELFLTQNSGAIDGTIYYWTSITPYPGIGNYQTGDYAKWNLTGSVGTNAANDSPSNTALRPDGQIVAGQGFFVQALVNNATVTFRNAQRLITDNTQFFRMAQPQATQSVAANKHRFWLNLTSENGHFNQMLIGYLPGATNDIDWGYDGFSVVNNPVNLYSHVNGKSLSIQGRALPFDQNDIVPLGLRITTAGTYKIALDEVDGLFSDDQIIYLEDLTTGAVHNLKQSPYSFTSAAGTFESRFQIRYTNETLGIDEVTVPSNTVWVYGTDVMTVVSSEELIANVVVHDLLGRRLYEAKNISAMQHVIALKPADQVVLVTITLGNGQVETRKVKF